MSEQPNNVTNLDDYRALKDGTPLDDSYSETGIYLHENNSVEDYSPETIARINHGRKVFNQVEAPVNVELSPVGVRSLKLQLLNNVREEYKKLHDDNALGKVA